MGRILVVDDDLEFCESVAKYLSLKGGYECDIATDHIQLVSKIKTSRYDLITLDVQLANENGIQLLPQIKKRFSGPIILISCLGDKDNKISGLRSGAIDYMVKPIVLEELYIKGKRLIENEQLKIMTRIDNYVIDEVNNIAYLDEKKLKLAEHSFLLLTFLLKNKGVVISRDRLAKVIWNYEQCESRIVDVTVSKVRQATGDNRIKTIRGCGYVYKDN